MSILCEQLHVVSISYGQIQGEMLYAAINKDFWGYCLSCGGTFFHQKPLDDFS